MQDKEIGGDTATTDASETATLKKKVEAVRDRYKEASGTGATVQERQAADLHTLAEAVLTLFA